MAKHISYSKSSTHVLQLIQLPFFFCLSHFFGGNYLSKQYNLQQQYHQQHQQHNHHNNDDKHDNDNNALLQVRYPPSSGLQHITTTHWGQHPAYPAIRFGENEEIGAPFCHVCRNTVLSEHHICVYQDWGWAHEVRPKSPRVVLVVRQRLFERHCGIGSLQARAPTTQVANGSGHCS